MPDDTVIRPEKTTARNTSSILTVVMYDQDGAPTTPASGYWSLYNYLDGSIINSENQISLNATSPTATINLGPLDNAILDNSLQVEEHRVVGVFFYGPTGNLQGSFEIQILVDNKVVY